MPDPLHGDHHNSKSLSVSEKVSSQRLQPRSQLSSDSTDHECWKETLRKLWPNFHYVRSPEWGNHKAQAEQEPEWVHHVQGETTEM